MNLKNSVIVITGASRGFGKILAESLNREGAKLILSGRSEGDLKDLAKKLKADYKLTDVSDEDQVNDLAEFVISKYGKIDIWINNAGMWMPQTKVENLDTQKLYEMMDVNFFGTVFGSKIALQKMRKQKSGVILNVISTAALTGRPLLSGYSASKYAVAGFTKSLLEENEDGDIKILSIYPGGMRTHLFDEKKPDDFTEYMDPQKAVEITIENLKKDNPEAELIIKRDSQI